MTDRVLISGGAGFIGFHLAKRLAVEGYKVCLVDNHYRGVFDRDLAELLKHPNATFTNIDLLDSQSVEKLGADFQVIVHLAAIIGVRHVLKRPYDVLWHNTSMLNNLITLGQRQTKLRRFLFASTSEIYAGGVEHYGLTIPTPEDSLLTVNEVSAPRTSYMLSKIMGEAMVQHSGLPFSIFRPHNIYGPRMGLAHVIPEQLRKAHDADPEDSIDVPSADHTRAFCFVSDSVEMLFRIMKNESCRDEVLNLGTEAPEITIGDVARLCIRTVNKSLVINELPPFEGSPKRRAPDMQKTKDLLEFESQISLPEGIEKTWAWYRENIFGSAGRSAI